MTTKRAAASEILTPVGPRQRINFRTVELDLAASTVLTGVRRPTGLKFHRMSVTTCFPHLKEAQPSREAQNRHEWQVWGGDLNCSSQHVPWKEVVERWA